MFTNIARYVLPTDLDWCALKMTVIQERRSFHLTKRIQWYEVKMLTWKKLMSTSTLNLTELGYPEIVFEVVFLIYHCLITSCMYSKLSNLEE